MSGSLKEKKIRKTEGTIATGHREYKPQSSFTFSQSFTIVSIMQIDRNTEEALKFFFRRQEKERKITWQCLF